MLLVTSACPPMSAVSVGRFIYIESKQMCPGGASASMMWTAAWNRFGQIAGNTNFKMSWKLGFRWAVHFCLRLLRCMPECIIQPAIRFISLCGVFLFRVPLPQILSVHMHIVRVQQWNIAELNFKWRAWLPGIQLTQFRGFPMTWLFAYSWCLW